MGAQATQAVPTMLELVPQGGDKWTGLQQLVADLGITTAQAGTRALARRPAGLHSADAAARR